jgi:hypoxanthine phosphoribosyltransferase
VTYSAAEIASAVRKLGEEINRDYAGEELLLLGVLKGSFIFLADLVREIEVPCTVDFVRLSSYGAGTSTTGRVQERLARTEPVAGRHVLVIEEIVDSGLTLAKLLGELAAEGPASLRICTLVDKTGRREAEVPVHYRGFSLEEGFLVGYGLDLAEKFRNLPDICVMEDPA